MENTEVLSEKEIEETRLLVSKIMELLSTLVLTKAPNHIILELRNLLSHYNENGYRDMEFGDTE